MDLVRLSAWTAALLLAGVATFQAGLAAGAPWGDMSYGGRADTVDGVLPGSYRVMSAAAIVILLVAAWVILARAGVASPWSSPPALLRGTTWFIFAYLVLNTVMNGTSSHPGERFGLGSITLVAAVACFIVARSPIDATTSP
jgi:hypothetical protein